jgi:tetratricopeptide (TPR) repeat protein
MMTRRRTLLMGIVLIAALTMGIGCESVGLRSMKIYMQQENWGKALEQGLTAVGENPEDDEAWFNIAYVASQLDSFDIMLNAIERTQALTNEHDEKIDAIRAIKYNELFNAAASDFNRGELDRAQGRLEIAYRIDPERPNAPKVLGLIAQQRGDLDGALENFGTAMRADTSDTDVARSYVSVLLQLDREDEARETIGEVYDMHPSNKEVALTYSMLLRRAGDLDRALEVIKASLVNEPMDADFNMEAGVLYLAKAQLVADDSLAVIASVTEAEPHFQNVLAVDSANVDAAYDLAMVYRQLGKLDLAAEPLEQVVEVAPDDVQARLQLANVLILLERYTDAEPHLETVVQKIGEPTNSEERAVAARAYQLLYIRYTVHYNDIVVQAQNLYEQAASARGGEKTRLQQEAQELEQQANEMLEKVKEAADLAKLYSE